MTVPLGTRASKMVRMGSAIPGFFDFGKFCILACLALLLPYSVYAMIVFKRKNTCLYDNDSVTPICGAKWKFQLSAGNHLTVSIAERTLYCVSFLLVYALKIYFYRKIRKQEAEADEAVTDITDYSVEIRGLPKDVTKQELRDFFTNSGIKDNKGNPIEIVRMNFAFTKIPELKKRDHDLTFLIGKYIQLKDKDPSKLPEIKESFQKLTTETINLISDKFRIELTNKKEQENFTGNCYVSFQTQQMEEAVGDKLSVKGLGKIVYKIFGFIRGPLRCFKGGRRHRLPNQKNGYFYIEKAEKPKEIYYENLGRSFKEIAITKLATLSITAIIIVGTFVAVLYLKKVEGEQKKKGNTLIPILITVVIKIIGFFCAFVSPKLVDAEKHETITKRHIGVIWRSCISIFLNSAMVITVATYFFSTDEELENDLYSDSGLTNNLLILVLFGILEPFVAFVDPFLFLKMMKRRKLVKEIESSTMMQYECNILYETSNFDFSRRAGKYCNIMLLVFFVIHIFPIASVIGVVWIFIYYWTDKYFLSRMSKVPDYCTGDLILSLLRVIDLCFLMSAISFAIFDQIVNESVSVWAITIIAVTGGNLLFNFQYILRKIFVFHSNESETAELTLRQYLSRAKSTDTYRGTNPVDILWSKVKVYNQPNFLENCQTQVDLDFADDSEKLLERVLKKVTKDKFNEMDFTPRIDNNRSVNFQRKPSNTEDVDEFDGMEKPLINLKPSGQILGGNSIKVKVDSERNI